MAIESRQLTMSIAQTYETTVLDRNSSLAATFVVVPARDLPSFQSSAGSPSLDSNLARALGLEIQALVRTIEELTQTIILIELTSQLEMDAPDITNLLQIILGSAKPRDFASSVEGTPRGRGATDQTRQLIKLYDQLDAANDRAAKLRAELEAAERRVAKLQAQIEAAHRPVAELQAELEAAERRLKKPRRAERRVAKLQAQIDASYRRVDELQAELEAVEPRVDELRAELEAAHRPVAELQAEIDAGHRRVDELQAELEAVEPRVDELRPQREATLTHEVDDLLQIWREREPAFDQFAAFLVQSEIVPFEESPLSAVSLAHLLTAAQAAGAEATAFLGVFGGRPLLCLALPTGLVMMGAARGMAEALRIGLRYRLLKLMRVPSSEWGTFGPDPPSDD